MTLEDRLVNEYLKRLGVAAKRLPEGRREDLLSDMREHIDVTLAETEPTSEAEIRELLDRLGDPEEIVTAALAEDRETGPAGQSRAALGGRELAVVVCFLLAGMLFFLAWTYPSGLCWAVGVVVLWTSDVWIRRDKLIGTFVVPVGACLNTLVFFAVSPEPAGWFTMAFLPVVTIATGIYLLLRARADVSG